MSALPDFMATPAPGASGVRAAMAGAPADAYELDQYDLELADDCARYYADPYGWVMWAFDWGYGELKGRDGPDTWQKDWLQDYGSQIRARAFNGVDPVDPMRFETLSGHGIGKAQPYSLDLDTPHGLRTWGDIRPGDELFGRDGSPVTVIARHEQGVRPMYRVTFNDGSSTLVDRDHLWTVKGRKQRRTSKSWVEMTTGEIISAGVKRSNGCTVARQWEIPGYDAVQYPEADLPIDPYILGVWLGDGSKHSGAVTSADVEVFESIVSAGYTLGNNRHSGSGDARTHVALGLMVQLRDAGIFGCTTQNCSVPQQYLHASVDQRAAVLQGLLDTDGWVEAAGTVAFGSISEQLNDDVVWLARSLGLVARNNGAKNKWYTGKDGSKIQGKPFYTSTITWDGDIQLFRLMRKQNKLTIPQSRYRTRWIDSIEYSHDEQAMCVTVDAVDQLYLTNDFIVTHNSALVGWLILFLMSTRPYARGIVTANTGDQLRTKTWSELAKWKKLCLTGHWFELNSGKGSLSMYHKSWPEEWRVDAQTCREENSEAFAGLHSSGSTPFYIFDEASAVPDKIWEVAEGGLTDGEPLFAAFGNPTRNTGAFARNAVSGRWSVKRVDSRTSKMTNKKLIQDWIDEHGDDSDFVRVRVKGQFPRAGDMQFMPSDIVKAGMEREPGVYLGTDPLICGIDMARGGDDNCMISFRRGFDAKSEKTYKIPGEKSRDSMRVVSLLTMILDRHMPDVSFIDVTGIGGPVGDRLRQLGYHVVDIGFGENANDEKHYKSRTAEMGAKLREWLMRGGAIPNDPQLEHELTVREFWHNDKDQLVLEPKKELKKRLGVSPDWADSLFLTFAMPVPALDVPRGQMDVSYHAREHVVNKRSGDYDPLDHV